MENGRPGLFLSPSITHVPVCEGEWVGGVRGESRREGMVFVCVCVCWEGAGGGIAVGRV